MRLQSHALLDKTVVKTTPSKLRILNTMPPCVLLTSFRFLTLGTTTWRARPMAGRACNRLGDSASRPASRAHQTPITTPICRHGAMNAAAICRRPGPGVGAFPNRCAGVIKRTTYGSAGLHEWQMLQRLSSNWKQLLRRLGVAAVIHVESYSTAAWSPLVKSKMGWSGGSVGLHGSALKGDDIYGRGCLDKEN